MSNRIYALLMRPDAAFLPFSLFYESADTCLYATWQGPHTGQPTRANYAQILQQAQTTPATKLLNDGLLDENGWHELVGWLADECFSSLAQAGIQAVAWVLPRHPQALYDTFQVLNRLTLPFVDTFSDAEAAYRWLHSLH